MVPWTQALRETNAEVLQLRRELGLDGAAGTPQEEFDAFLEQSKQLTPRALRAAEREFEASEKLEEERDYLSFLKSSGQVPAEHPPAAEFDAFLEESKQLTPKALRAAEREFKASEEAEEQEDFAQFLQSSGQVLVPPRGASLDAMPTGAGGDAGAARALQRTIVEIAALKAELGIQDNTPQEEFDAFLEQSKQLTPRALRAAEREFMESEKLEEERDYLSFLKSSGQVPAEHPPQAEFDAFLEESKQLTPKALRAAEREFEASEEVEDYRAILEEGGPIAVPVRSGDIDSVLQSAEADILKLRAELLGGDQGSVDGWGSQTQRL